MKKKIVTIIILNWNGLKNTLLCLDSLLMINYPYVNIIVVDNGSKNNDADVLLKKYKNKIVVHKLKNNLGFTGGVNEGLKLAKKKYTSEYYLLLNNDVTVKKNFLNHLVHTAESNKLYGIVGPLIYDETDKQKILFSGGSFKWLEGKTYHRHTLIEKSQECPFVTGCCFLIKKSVIEKIGVLDERFFAYFEDAAYCLSATTAGFKCAVNPKAKIYHNESSSMGKKNKTYTYLFSRNRILFINNYTSIPYRIYFYFFNFIKLIAVETYFLLTKQTIRASAFFKGYIDGNLGKEGTPKL